MSLPPLRRQVLVGCDQPTAYRLFTDEIGAWWPLESHGCFGPGGSVAFDGRRIVETGPSGEIATWGTVTADDPPRSISCTGHPGQAPAEATHVTVAFASTGDSDVTLVTLEHSGWEAYRDPAAARGNYAGGWVVVLGCYADAPPAPDDATDLWFVLEHSAGPAAPPEGVFASPDFAKHAQFLGQLHADGFLVAAGPLPDTPGAGMTIVRASSQAGARQVIRAAQLEDGSVTSGLLDVRVRPWRVMLTG